MIDVPIQVKDALREGRLRKNYRFQVLNDDGTVDFTIDNDNLVSESVNIDERMCSGDQIKYGLCEGSSLEFQYFGKENITGRQLKVFVDVEYEDESAYTYADVEEFPRFDSVTITTPGHYKVYSAVEGVSFEVYLTRGSKTTGFDSVATEDGAEIVLGELKSGDSLELTWGSMFWTAPMLQVGTAVPYAIPMGYFTVKNCSRQASTGIIKVTAYNKLQSDYLDAKANELVDDIIAQGEDGSSEVSLYTILKSVLEDYAIEEYTETSQDVPVYTGYMYNVDYVPATYSDGTPEGGYWLGYMVSAGISLNTSDYYKFVTDLSAIKNKIYYLFTNSMYTVVNNRVYSMRNFAKSNLSRSQFFGGRLGFVEEARPTIFGADDSIDSRYYTNNTHLVISIPVIVDYSTTPKSNITDSDITRMENKFEQMMQETGFSITVVKKNLSNMEKYRIGNDDVKTDVTLRDLQSAVYETSCQFGQLSRETDLFSGVELNRSRLLPADTLYPDNALYPNGAQESAFRSQYSKLWADEGNVRKWRYLIITYKGLDENQQEKDFTLQRTVNANGTDDYNCSDNWLFRNLVWTAEQIGEYADAMVAKMQDITWFPFELWCAGLPYLETGDEIEIPLGEETYTSYILQRQLKGIQNLQDTYINGTLDIF